MGMVIKSLGAVTLVAATLGWLAVQPAQAQTYSNRTRSEANCRIGGWRSNDSDRRQDHRQDRREIRRDLRGIDRDRQQLRNAVRRNDWDRARQERREIRGGYRELREDRRDRWD
ncbi:MAG: hypothetical protein SFU56_10545 [Capsulimonadales bacterium]|nr:hypothetical protein [Capsulimonadales bacterium]